MIPSPSEIEKEIPQSTYQAAFIQGSRKEVEDILNGSDSRLLLIVGPCSLHDADAALDYGYRFKKLADRVSDQICMVMRAYIEKPRTILGWKGMLNDPNLDGSYDLLKGIRKTRKLFADLTSIGVPLGCELLDVMATSYYSSFLTWGCIGARTSASSPHRQLAAQLPFPIGFKNTTDGNVDIPIHAIIAASNSHIFLGLSAQGNLTRIEAQGNAHGHIVMRGGSEGPNYYEKDLQQALEKCEKLGVQTDLIVDCSHDNCGKNYRKQTQVFEDVLQQILNGNHRIAGMMLESNLEAGSQLLQAPLHYGVSVTDPCLDWSSTEHLIEAAYSKLKARTERLNMPKSRLSATLSLN